MFNFTFISKKSFLSFLKKVNLILINISLVKFVPITHPSNALAKGSGFLGSFISILIAQKKPIINKGPNIHGRGMPILTANNPPITAKNILSK